MIAAAPDSGTKAAADIREGQDFPKLWATWHYDWSAPGSVTLTVTESDALQPGGYMTLSATPRVEGGSAVHGDRDAVHRSAALVVVLQKVYDGL